MHIEQGNPFVCKECGWQFPKELVDSLIKEEEPIYCEKCGIANNKNDFNERQISQKIHEEKSKNLFTILSNTKKKIKKKIESKLKESRKK